MPPGTEELAFPLPDPVGASRNELALSAGVGLSADGQAGNTGQGDREIVQALTERGERSAAQAADDLSELAGLVPGEIDERERGAVGADPQDERDDVERRAVVGRREGAIGGP